MAFLTLLAMTAAIITLIHVILTLLAMRAAVAPTSCRSSLRTLKTYFKTEFFVTFNITVSFVRGCSQFCPIFFENKLKIRAFAGPGHFHLKIWLIAATFWPCNWHLK